MKIFFLIVLVLSTLHSFDEKYKLGEEIYKATCISCHGKNGISDKSIRLIVKPRSLSKTILSEEQSYNIIKKGAKYWGASADMMPSFESVYDEKELRSIAYYISMKFNKNVKNKIDTLYSQSDTITKEREKKMLKRGLKIYKRNCSWCHGLEGRGNGEATRNPEMSIFPYDLTKTLLDDKQIFLYVKYGGQYWGTDKNDMPAWSPKYDDFTIKSVVKYVEMHIKK